MREGVLHWLLLVAAAAAAVVVALGGQGRRPVAALAVEPLAAVPLGASLLVTVDVTALAGVLPREALQVAGEGLLGLGDTCGFEPLLSIQRAAFSMPFQSQASSEHADFALIAATTLKEQPLADCAEALIRKRGGAPVRSRIGRYLSVRDAGKPLGGVALRADGLLVLSGGQYFRDVVDPPRGARPRDEAAHLRGELHAELRRRLGPAEVLVTFLPGPAFSVPDLEFLGFSLKVERELRLRGLVGCRSHSACIATKLSLERLKGELVGDLGVAALAELKVEQRELQLELAVTFPRSELGVLLKQALGSP